MVCLVGDWEIGPVGRKLHHKHCIHFVFWAVWIYYLFRNLKQELYSETVLKYLNSIDDTIINHLSFY